MLLLNDFIAHDESDRWQLEALIRSESDAIRIIHEELGRTHILDGIYEVLRRLILTSGQA